MLHPSAEFREYLNNDDRRYIEQAIITARDINGDPTTLTLREDEIWSDGFSIESAISSDNSFELGGGIIGKATLVINNISGDYTDINFTDATVTLKVGHFMIDDPIEWLSKGVYTVDDATYAGEIITLSCLDNMHKFDKDYSTIHTIYSANLQRIVVDICTGCGVTFSNATQEFPHWDAQVPARPDDEGITCREMLTYVAQAVGCYAFCDNLGHLRIQDINFSGIDTVEVSGRKVPVVKDNNNVPVGEPGFDPDNYNPWNQKCHLITGTYSSTIGVDDVIITGVAVTNEIDDEEVTVLEGNLGYVIAIRNNPLIQLQTGESNKVTMENVASWVGGKNDSADTHCLIGRRFRTASLSHLSDPSIEPGDVAYVRTRKGVYYPIIISSTTFAPHNAQSTRSSAETPARNSATRYSAETQTYIALRKLIEHEKTEREAAIEDLNDRIVTNAVGLYTTEVPDTQHGGTIYYMHNHENLEDSTIVWKFTAEAWGVATGNDVNITKSGTTYTDNSTYSYGMTSFGDAVMNAIYATKIVADYINLYGDMVVFQDSSLASSGGKLGFGLGQTYWGQTNGIHLLSLNSNAEVIATTAGARISYYDSQDPDATATAVVATSEETRMRTIGDNTIGDCESIAITNTNYSALAFNLLKYTYTYVPTGEEREAWMRTSDIACRSTGSIMRAVYREGFSDQILNSVATNANDVTLLHRSGLTDTHDSSLVLSDDSAVLSVPHGNVEVTGARTAVVNGALLAKMQTGTGSLDHYIECLYDGQNGGRVRIEYSSSTFINIFRDSSNTEVIALSSGSNVTYWTPGGWSGSSDKRLKKNISYNVDPDIVDKLKPASFQYKNTNKTKYGFIAQDVQKVIPEIVEKMPNSEYLGLDYNDFSALLVAKVQKQQGIIEEQQETIDKQQKKIEELESRLTKIEELLNATK